MAITMITNHLYSIAITICADCKNKKELKEYLKNLVKIKKNPTLEDVKFSFKWGTIPCDQ